MATIQLPFQVVGQRNQLRNRRYLKRGLISYFQVPLRLYTQCSHTVMGEAIVSLQQDRSQLPLV